MEIRAPERPTLRDALATLGERRGEDALAQLLDVWDATRSPAVADAVERLGERLGGWRPPVVHPRERGLRIAAWDAAWSERASNADDVEWSVLLPWLAEGNSVRAEPRLQTLAERRPDPRIGRRLVDLVEQPPFVTKESWRFGGPAFEIFPRHADRSTAGALRQAVADLRKGAFGGLPRFRLALETALSHLEPLLGACRPEPDEEALLPKILARIDALPISEHERRQRTQREFLGEIAAAPGDSEIRLVYADWLTEQGDPLGEFINLQCAQEDRELSAREQRREAALRKRYEDRWLGPLAGMFQHLIFRRGFPFHGTLDTLFRTPVAEKAAGDPRWGTIEYLNDVSSFWRPVVLHPIMKRLLSVSADEDVAYHLVTDTLERSIESLTFKSTFRAAFLSWKKERFRAMAECSGLPRLRKVNFLNGDTSASQGVEWIQVLLSGPFGRQLESLSVSLTLDRLPDWWQALQHPDSLFQGTLRTLGSNLRCVLRPDDRGDYSRLKIVLPKDNYGIAKELTEDDLETFFRALPADALTQVEVYGDLEAPARVEMAARSQYRLEHLVVGPDHLREDS